MKALSRPILARRVLARALCPSADHPSILEAPPLPGTRDRERDFEQVRGLGLDAATDTVRFRHPRLPGFPDEGVLRNLHVGSSVADVAVHRRGDTVAVTVLRKTGSATVEVTL